MIKEPDTRLKILPEDLDDRELYRVNQVVNDLYSKVDSVRIDGKFYGRSQFEDLWQNTDRDPTNLDGSEVLNLREIRKLGINPTTNTVRVISGGGGGGGGGGANTTVQYPPAITYLDAVSRLLSEKVGETISVLDFGAVADAGVTDNSDAFNAAIQAALYSGRGKRILIPAAPTGSWYRCDSKIIVDNRYYLHGTVNTSGTTVTWASGDEFPDYIGSGWTITIDGNDYTVSSRTSSTELELTGTPTGDPLTGVTYRAISTSFVPLAFEGEGDLSLVKRGADLNPKEGLFDVKGESITFHNFKVDGDVTTPTELQYSEFNQSGTVNTSGTSVTLATGTNFANLQAGDSILINNKMYTVDTTGTSSITLTSSAGSQTGVSYASSNAMMTALTKNTSFWIHGPSKNVSFIKVTVTHTGGYSILIDATNGANAYDSGNYDIHNTQVLFCKFLNNRPNLFGNGGAAEYGSWTGGVFLNTYGLQDGANYLSTVYNTLVQGCYFEGNTGNCVWSHLYGFDILFSDLRVLGNTFIDNGLDCILFGGVTGGACIGNRTRRTGYIATDTSLDVSESNPTVPKWLSGLNATAIDTSGICKNVTYANNSIISTNGGDMDLDGFCDGHVTGNVCMTPRSYDPEYTEDSISLTGPSGYPGQWSYGIQPSNSYGEEWGSKNVSITGNTFINKDGGAIRLAACRNGMVTANNIWHPAGANYPPIILFNIGTGQYQRTYDTVVFNNVIHYDPASPVASIEEWGDALSYPAFQPGDKNWIHGNQIIGDSYEFYKDADTDSTTGITVSMSYAALSSRSDTFITRKRSVVTNGNFDYLQFNYNYGSSDTQAAYLSDHAIIGIGGYVDTLGTAVDWVSGDDFSSFANGDQIGINGTPYTILTVNSSISITLTTSAGTQSAVPFTNPVYKWGAPMLGVGDGTNGSISTGNRSILPFNDIIATNVFAGDGFLSLTDTLIDEEKANKLPDTYGLLRYNSTSKVFEYSNSATSGVRVWTTLSGGGGTPGGSNTYVQINDSGSFGGFSSLTFNKTTKLLTVTGTAGTPSIKSAAGYIESAGGYLSTVDSYNAIQAWIPASSIAGGALLSGVGLGEVSGRGGYIDLQAIAGSYPGTLTNLASFGATDVILWAGSSNGTASPNTTNGLQTNAFFESPVGFVSTATNTDTIQAPLGGVTAKYLIGTVSFNLTGTSSGTAGLSNPGQGRIYFDSTANAFKVSQNGGAYVNLVGASPAGSDGYVQYNVSSALAANINFFYDTTKNYLSLGGETTPANITSRLYVRGSANIWGDTSNQIVILARGASGQTANLIDAQDNGGNSLFAVDKAGGVYLRTSGSPSPIAGTGLIYYDTSTNKLKASQNGAAAVDLLSGATVAGSTGYIQYNTSGALDANVNLFWDSANSRLSLGGTTSGLTARLYVRGAAHVWADGASQTVVLAKGTASQSGNLFEAQNNAGSSFWALAANGGMYFRSVSTPSLDGTAGIIYFDGTNFKYTEGASGPFLLSGVRSLNSLTGTLSVVAGTSISVSAAGSSITVATTQDLTTSGSPSFVSATLNNGNGLNLKNASGTARKVLSLESTNDLYLDNISDGNIYIRPVSSGAIVLGRDPSVSGSVLPNGDNRVTLGNSSNGWTNVYARAYYYWNGSSYVAGVFGGVTSVSAGSGISVSGTTAVTVTNTGVTSLTAGAGVSLSGSTGGVTVSIGQSVSTTAAVSFNSTTYPNGASNGVYIKNTTGTALNRLCVASDNNVYLDNQDSGSGDIYIRPYPGRYIVVGISGSTGGVLPFGNNMTMGNSTNAWSTIYASSYRTPSGNGASGSFNPASVTNITVSGGIITGWS